MKYNAPILDVSDSPQRSLSVLATLNSTPKLIRTLVLVTFSSLVLFLETAQSQTYGTSSHDITVAVSTITLIQVSSGAVNLTIDGTGVAAGQDEMSTTDESTSLQWGVNSGNRKITVNTNLVAPTFVLKVFAVSPTQGIAAGEVTISSADADLLYDIGKSTGSCSLRYTGVAYASQGIGSDAHTLTFTVTTQ